MPTEWAPKYAPLMTTSIRENAVSAPPTISEAVRGWRQARSCAVSCIAVLGVVAMNLACGSQAPATTSTRHASPRKSTALSAPDPRAGAWLGLNYNSSRGIGHLDDFSARRIVYDRIGTLEPDAGETLARNPQFAHGVRESLLAGMIPDIEIDPTRGPVGCTGDPTTRDRCLPRARADIKAYVSGFVATARSVLRGHPASQVLFEPMDEPWDWAAPPGTPSGRLAAAEYAAVLARLLPAAKAAGIPLARIYIPATGQLSDGTSWVADLYQAQPCLMPGPRSCGPIAGWNVHPYGLPNSTTAGIDSVPVDRAGMLTGKNNIIVSEIGFCARDVARGRDCDQNRTDVVGTSAQTAVWLGETLNEALPMHRAGWLRALLVWNRAAGGWAMQNPNGSLTPQGKVLAHFASAHATR